MSALAPKATVFFTRSIEARHEAKLYVIVTVEEHDGNGGRRRFGHQCRCVCVGNDYSDPPINQIGHQARQSIILSFRPAIFDC